MRLNAGTPVIFRIVDIGTLPVATFTRCTLLHARQATISYMSLLSAGRKSTVDAQTGARTLISGDCHRRTMTQIGGLR